MDNPAQNAPQPVGLWQPLQALPLLPALSALHEKQTNTRTKARALLRDGAEGDGEGDARTCWAPAVCQAERQPPLLD